MPSRALASAMISFGLVSIPVRLYAAAVQEDVRFHLLHVKCGNRIRYQSYCPVDEEVVPPAQIVKGYEVAKGRFVRMTADELESLEGEASREIRIEEFVPLATVDPVQVDRSYYLGPDRGGARAYGLLHGALAESAKAAVGRFVLRGKESLVVIRAPVAQSPAALLLHTLYFHDEIRELSGVEVGRSAGRARERRRGETHTTARLPVDRRGSGRPAERQLALKLIGELSRDRFEPERYEDEYRARVLRYIRGKAAGKAAALPETTRPERGRVIDLMDALRRSLDGREPRETRRGRRGPPRRASGRGRRGRAVAARTRRSA